MGERWSTGCGVKLRCHITWIDRESQSDEHAMNWRRTLPWHVTYDHELVTQRHFCRRVFTNRLVMATKTPSIICNPRVWNNCIATPVHRPHRLSSISAMQLSIAKRCPIFIRIPITKASITGQYCKHYPEKVRRWPNRPICPSPKRSWFKSIHCAL